MVKYPRLCVSKICEGRFLTLFGGFVLNYNVRFTGRRVICWLVAVALLIATIPYFAPATGAYSDVFPLPVLTGDKAQDTANIALSQLGYDEDSDGSTYFGAWWTSQVSWDYDYTYAGWCAMFACWCANQAGAGMGIAYDMSSASPAYLMDWLRQNAWVDTTFSTTPQPGDFIFFGYGSYAEHIAVVVGYDADSNVVTFVGGNQSDSVTKQNILWSASGLYGDQNIVGYGRPNYGQAVSVPAKPNVSAERDVYFGGTEVTFGWKPVAGAANYTVEIYRDDVLYLQDTMVDLSWFTLSQAEAGNYTVYVTARNCAGLSSAGCCSFSVIESMPNVPVWVTDATLEAAQENAKFNLILDGFDIFADWYHQSGFDSLFR